MEPEDIKVKVYSGAGKCHVSYWHGSRCLYAHSITTEGRSQAVVMAKALAHYRAVVHRKIFGKAFPYNLGS